MKKWWLLLFLLLLACAKETETTKIVDQSMPELPEQQIEKPIPPKPEVLPLEVDLSAGRTKAELELNTTMSCIASEGKKPYSYEWAGHDSVQSCRQECDVSLPIGEYNITCTVIAGKETQSKTLHLSVTKERRNIENVITFGDSLTYGHGLEDPETQSWAYLFAKKYNANLLNYARSGDTSWGVTDQYLQFKGEVPDGEKMLFIWIGANDIVNLISPEQFESNYRSVLNQTIELSDDVILITIPDVSKLTVANVVEENVNTFLSDFGVNLEVKKIGQDVISAYNGIIFTLSREYDLQVIDMYSYMEDFDNKLVSEDMFHPTAEGQEEVMKKVVLELEERYPTVEFS